MILLLDGDILVYQALSSSEHEVNWEDDYWTLYSDIGSAKAHFSQKIKDITSYVNPKSIHVCLSDKVNWRHSIYPDYKGNRKNTRKPLGFTEFKEWVATEYTTIVKPNLEADDVLGILATKPNSNAVIWSIDKDLKQIPAKHIENGKIIQITEDEADHWHYMQMLTGDPTDGYKGCPNMGKVKAEKLLAKVENEPIDSTWADIVSAYAKEGLTEADALVQARISRICRWSDWDQQSQTVKLWNPHA